MTDEELSELEQNLPFRSLDKKWVKLLSLAMKEGEAAGFEPSKYYVDLAVIRYDGAARYLISFFEKPFDVWDYEQTGNDFNVSIAVKDLDDIKIEIQKGHHKFRDGNGKNRL